MMPHPSLGIVIPTYNRKHLVVRAINSAKCQLIEGDRIIVVDDGSSDGSLETLRKLYGNDSQVQLFGYPGRQGTMKARNRGVSRCNTDWVCFLDSDDTYLDGALETIRYAISRLSDHYGLIQFTTIAKSSDDSVTQRGYCPPHSWNTRVPTRADVVFNRNIIGDLHRCYSRELFLAHQYCESNPDNELYHYATLARRGVPTIYLNQNVVCVDLSSPNRHSRCVLRERTVEYQRIQLKLFCEHSLLFLSHPFELVKGLHRILWLQQLDGKRVCLPLRGLTFFLGQLIELRKRVRVDRPDRNQGSG